MMISKYSRSFNKPDPPYDQVRVITDLSQRPNDKPCILIRDISEYGNEFRDEIYLSEINQLLPNYGCSSDLLRLRILFAEGGCYFDQDVPLNPNLSLEKSGIFNHRKRYCIILEHRPQRSTPENFIPSDDSQDSVIIAGSPPDVSSQESSRDSGEHREASESTDDSYTRFIKLRLRHHNIEK